MTDAGLAHLKDIKGLEHLHLNGLKVTDAGLERLRELKNLTHLQVQKTRVAKGVAAFHAAVPGCKIEHDGGSSLSMRDFAERPSPSAERGPPRATNCALFPARRALAWRSGSDGCC